MVICRQKKKSISILLLCAFCATVLWGCGSRTAEAQNENTDETVETAEITEASDSEAVAETVALTEQELEQLCHDTDGQLRCIYCEQKV